MMKDKFYKNVHASLANFQPEVPASVYQGVRKKMWLSSFTTFQLSRFNMWYVLIGLALAGTAYGVSMNQKSTAEKATTYSVELPSAPLVNEMPASPEAAMATVSTKSRNEVCSKSRSTSAHVASCTSQTAPEESQAVVAEAAFENKPEAQQEVTQQEHSAFPVETPTVAPKGKRLIVPVWVDDNK
jgi:hypothetical protein